ncbi:T9SS type A sorting domain-containing protein [Flammeovirga aprica]|uniref:T9SS type A sorting domain-containing protein n=1 Tax=Flammeovirga aprica JL-4 TaxID=694437 RepID=A0A7X9P270_9BACT|nr:T9SS type A sorting domain-containing protein [Flammeovirga aprica]NME67642.1 T9SS type A sorting domain-containing protein [Flammeovirga aprica JL-4]
MTKIFTTLLLVLSVQFAFAQDDVYSEYLLSKLQELEHDHTSSHGRHHGGKINCGTPLFLEAHRNWGRLNAKAQAAFTASSGRHTYDSPKVYESQYFTLHYTLTGDDAIDATDQDGNNIPDYIDLVATISDNVFKIDIQDRGFNAPPSDSGLGGSNKPDIYIYNLESGVYGTVAPEVNLGDNSATTITETASYTSHMNLRNNYSGFGGSEEENLKVTLAHELSHMIDFGYNYNFPTWFLEAKGAWEEKRIYPNLTDNFQYLTSFVNPDYALDYGSYNIDDNADEKSTRWYSGWLLFQLVYENLEDQTHPFFRKILERGVGYTSDEWGYSFINGELEDLFGIDLNEAHRRFRVTMGLMTSDTNMNEDYVLKDVAKYKNYLKDTYSNDGERYSFLYKDFGPISVESEFSLDASANEMVEYSSATDGNNRLNRLAADYLHFQSKGAENVEIKLTADEDEDVMMDVILFNTTTNKATVLTDSSNHTLTIENPDQYEFKIIVVTRNDDELDGSTDATYQITAKKVGNVTSLVDDLQKITIGPNPTNGLINISYDANTVKNILVHDITGKLKGTFEAKTFNTDVVLDGEKGMYFITLDNGKTFKVIKN